MHQSVGISACNRKTNVNPTSQTGASNMDAAICLAHMVVMHKFA